MFFFWFDDMQGNYTYMYTIVVTRIFDTFSWCKSMQIEKEFPFLVLLFLRLV
jgi:hypothetical protein